jgi:hypothetical protein
VGGFNHLEKYEFVNGKDDIPYMKWKIEAMHVPNNQPDQLSYVEQMSESNHGILPQTDRKVFVIRRT